MRTSSSQRCSTSVAASFTQRRGQSTPSRTWATWRRSTRRTHWPSAPGGSFGGHPRGQGARYRHWRPLHEPRRRRRIRGDSRSRRRPGSRRPNQVGRTKRREGPVISGSRLRQAREAVPLTQKELAESSGIAQPILSKIEVGARIASIEEARSLAFAVGVPVRFLFRDPILLPDGSLGLFRSTSSKVKSSEYTAARRLAEIGSEVLASLGKNTDLPPVRIHSVRRRETEAAASYAASDATAPTWTSPLKT